MRLLSIFHGLLQFLCVIEAAVISIDFGTEWVKVAIAKAPNTREIVLNAISKRKTAAGITIRGLERTFDADMVKVSVQNKISIQE